MQTDSWGCTVVGVKAREEMPFRYWELNNSLQGQSDSGRQAKRGQGISIPGHIKNLTRSIPGSCSKLILL